MKNSTNQAIAGAYDLYNLMLEIKNGMANGSRRGCTRFTKKQAKEIGIDWSFVEQSVIILGLTMKRDGCKGFLISL